MDISVVQVEVVKPHSGRLLILNYSVIYWGTRITVVNEF